MPDSPPSQTLQLKVQLRDVHPAVWRRVRVVDRLSVADLHRVIQVLMGWKDDHLHRFRIHGQSYGIPAIGGLHFGEDAEAVPLARFRFRPTERFLYEYDFHAGWRIDIRVEKVLAAVPRPPHPVCLAGRETSPPDACGGPQDFADQRRAATGWAMAEVLLQRLRQGWDRVEPRPVRQLGWRRDAIQEEPVQGSAVHGGGDPVGGALVSAVPDQLPRSGTDAGRPRRRG